MATADPPSWTRHSSVPDKGDVANLPGPRWGHSMTVVGQIAFLFGGVEASGETGSEFPALVESTRGSAAMFVLRMTASAMVRLDRFHRCLSDR